MKELRSEVRSLVKIELERANEQFPLFHSDHEGISVIREEMQEANADAGSLYELVNMLEQAVFTDMDFEVKKSRAFDAEREAIELACEAIQTAAMLHKFVDSHLWTSAEPVKESFCQEEADMLANECPEANLLQPNYTDFAKFLEQLVIRKQRVEEGK